MMREMKEELKPCPFCGGTDIDVEQSIKELCFAACNQCGAFGPSGDGKNGAVAAWNRRKPFSRTNADRIRSMTNEEMAETLPCLGEIGLAEITCDHNDSEDCYTCLLGWLNKPEE